MTSTPPTPEVPDAIKAKAAEVTRRAEARKAWVAKMKRILEKKD